MEKLKKNDKVKIINTDNIWKNKEATVIEQSNDELFDDEGLDITLVKVKIIFGDEDDPKIIIQEFPRYCLELENKNEMLNEKIVVEALKSKKVDDYIRDYVYAETLDDIVSSWFFIDKLAAIENLTSETVLEDAKTLKYHIYRIIAPFFDKLVVAAPRCKKQAIYDDYADYLQGPVEVREV